MKRFCFLIWLAAVDLLSISVHAEYHDFNVSAPADGIVQDVRWPYWAESTYNAIYYQTIAGTDGGSAFFYGGMPSDPGGNPPCSIIWSFWPPSGTAVPGAAVTAYWTTTNMYAPPHIGEGASGKVQGNWPLIQSNRWYREVLRVWQPADGTPHLGYAGRWLRDPATSNWFHIATMKLPFTPTGVNGLSGFQEDFGNGNRSPRRTDFRNVYYHKYGGGAWQMANRFTPSVRQLGESGTCGVLENATAAFFETCSGSNYLYDVTNHLPATTGNLVMLVATNWSSASFVTNPPAGVDIVAAARNNAQYTCVMTNQPAAPAIDAIIVNGATSSVSGNQLITTWQLPATSSPQLAYKIEVFNNSGYAGLPSVSFYDIDPEARQKLLDITGVSTPYVRLTITDIFNVTNASISLTPARINLNTATTPTGATNGLSYKYYEAASNYVTLPNFVALTPAYQGAVNFPDLTVRRARTHYAVNFTGYINAPTDGLYTFTLNSADGSRLAIDGRNIVNWDGEHSPAPMNGWAALATGMHAVSLQFFFDNESGDTGDLIDGLTVSWSGPGIAAGTAIPVNAWYRQPDAAEPAVALTAPADGSCVCGTNVELKATVATNGATINKVQFYLGNNYWGRAVAAPFNLNSFVWAATSNLFRARVFYNSSNTVDSAQSVVTTTNMTLDPWLLASMSDHTYPNGAKISGGTFTLMGDGLNFLGRQVTGDCTLVAHRAGFTRPAAGPDGQRPDSGWSAGIIMRGTTNTTPGSPFGDGRITRYACAFNTLDHATFYEDDTIANGGGQYAVDIPGSHAWYKIQRVANTFTTSVSSDGATWTSVNTNTLRGIGKIIYAGLFTYAASSQNPNVHWAAFDHVTITGDVVDP